MTRLLPLLLLCLVALSASAQPASTTRGSMLRTGPYRTSKRIHLLPVGTALTIISKYPRAGYVRVQTGDGETGWVLERNLSVSAEPGPTTTTTTPTTPASGTRAGADEIYADATMTPGKPDPTVTQANIAQNICNNDWSTESVRPSTSVTSKIKKQTMAAYGFTDASNHYELDHLISLQNGGCPDCVENLWPEAYGDRAHPMTQNERAAWNKTHDASTVQPGSLEKDLVENHVHDEICFGIPNAKKSGYAKKYPATVGVSLARGQQILTTDWYACYLKIMDGNKPCE